MLLHCSGRYDDAIKCYDQALSIDQKYAILFYNKGSALGMLNYRKVYIAISCYDQAIRISPQYALAYNNKGNSLQTISACAQYVVWIELRRQQVVTIKQLILIQAILLPKKTEVIFHYNLGMVLFIESLKNEIEQQGKTPEPKIFNGRPIINK